MTPGKIKDSQGGEIMSTRKVNDPDSGYMVVIRFIGETTTATLMHGDREVKTAEAKCSHVDQFRYDEGAKAAVGRLLAKKKKPSRTSWIKDPAEAFFVVNTDYQRSFSPGEIVERVGFGATADLYVNKRGKTAWLRRCEVRRYVVK